MSELRYDRNMRVLLGVLVGGVGCSSSGDSRTDAATPDSPPIVEELADPCVIDDVGSPPSATFFVASDGDGSTGTSWASAWKDVADIEWAKITPGTLVSLAGGTYGDLSIQTAGSSAQRICIKRAVATDPQCGTATAGWKSGYDAQVVLTGLACNTPGMGSYVTVDGRVAYAGIKIDDRTLTENYSIDLNESGANYLRLYNLDSAGSSTLTTDFTGEGRSLSANFSGTANGLQIAYSQFHGKPTLILTGGQHGMVFEHNRLFDNVVGNPASWHPNVWVSTENDVDVTWRFNEVWNWMVEGIMMCPNGAGCTPDSDWYIYGNVWHDAAAGGSARVLEAQYVTHGAVYVYNNTFVNLAYVMGSQGNGGMFSSGVATNNLMWGTASNWTEWGITDTASTNLVSSDDLFVDSTTGDFHLAGSATAAINTGVSIAPVAGQLFDHDMDAHVRGADGAWDLGAYEH